MALTDESGVGTTMLVGPANAYGNNGFGGDWAWIILLLLLGWGNNGFGGGFGGGNYDFPWLMNGQQNIMTNTNNGFRDAMLNDGITSVRDGINGLSAQLCNGFAQAEIGENARQMANMQQMFDLQSALQNCCCENRASIADVKYTIATEACATRNANSQNTQAILDKLCQLELDNYKRENDQLRSQLQFANMQASQNAQTAAILANNEAQTTALEQYLAPVPRPAYVVQNPNCCANNCGTNCGCGV